MATTAPAPVLRLLEIDRSFMEPAVENHPRGREVLARFPDA